MNSQNIIDISPTISSQLAVFPGDKKFTRHEVLDFKKGDHLKLSWAEGSLHLGAHVDASNHYHQNGKGINEVDLSTYLGDCQVIEVPKVKRIGVDDLKNKHISSSRILFKTSSFPDPNTWNHDFSALSPELIEYLVKKGVKLVGIDTPSIDPANDQDLLSHKAVYKNKMAILEGIILEHVHPGLYFLSALPLKIKDADASPVRAILWQK